MVEVLSPDDGEDGFRIGSNGEAQTAPSYLAASGCGLSDPVDIAALGVPEVQIVMNVTGDVGDDSLPCFVPGDRPWVSVSPDSGMTGDSPSEVTVTFDANGLSGGLYQSYLCINSDDPDRPLVQVPVSLEVKGGSSGGGEAGVIIDESAGITDVAEGSDDFAGYTMVLTSQPTSEVIIQTVENSGQVTISPARLIFDATNWDQPQMIRVLAVDDSVSEGVHEAYIWHRIISGDPAYGANFGNNVMFTSNGPTANSDPRTVLVYITDNDTAAALNQSTAPLSAETTPAVADSAPTVAPDEAQSREATPDEASAAVDGEVDGTVTAMEEANEVEGNASDEADSGGLDIRIYLPANNQ